MAARNSGIRASELVGVRNSRNALDFDLAATFRLNEYDLKREREKAKTTGLACALAFAGESLKFDDDSNESFEERTKHIPEEW